MWRKLFLDIRSVEFPNSTVVSCEFLRSVEFPNSTVVSCEFEIRFSMHAFRFAYYTAEFGNSAELRIGIGNAMVQNSIIL